MRQVGSRRIAFRLLGGLFPTLLLACVAQAQDLVPGTTLAHGAGAIRQAWFAAPTTRYPHGALGDPVEAGALVLRNPAGADYRLTLPEERVFEDLVPRLVTAGGLGDAAMVIESDRDQGARLSFYGLRQEQVVLLAATPFIGRSNRWLALVGIGDFDGDGRAEEVALVAMPHLAGLLRVYRLQAGTLPLLAEAAGYSNHVYGRAEIAMSAVMKAAGRDLILVPDRGRRRLLRLSLRDGRLAEEEGAAQVLPAPLRRLRPEGAGFTAELDDGRVIPVPP
ncbi:hypothetical protein [Ferrovibrio sp.]|uniref:hypothetical protein n=1 Tax=Ferrovibrio sp. TaxID=1917215 RepID=UPI00311E3570